jgi:hypothetical protein
MPFQGVFYGYEFHDIQTSKQPQIWGFTGSPGNIGRKKKRIKEHLSDYRRWEQLSPTQEWLLFPENIGLYLSIGETSLFNGEL